MSSVYICLLLIKHPDTGGMLSFTSLEVAQSKEDALKQATAKVREGAFASGTRNWIVESSSANEIDRELIERAATEVLGWSPPTT